MEITLNTLKSFYEDKSANSYKVLINDSVMTDTSCWPLWFLFSSSNFHCVSLLEGFIWPFEPGLLIDVPDNKTWRIVP